MRAQDLRPPANIVAGDTFSIAATGHPDATFYLFGPGASIKQAIPRGNEIEVKAGDVRVAGRYVAVLCGDTCRSTAFYVAPAAPASLSFLVHPSRTPVGQKDAISGVAFPFDKFHNLVLAPVTISFRVTAGDTPLMASAVPTRQGVSWFRASAGNRAGTGVVVASVNDVSARRVVRLVAADPCNLRIKAQTVKTGVLVETEPVRDCGGNPVPDGTIVTFTEASPNGKSTVDAPIKQGVARARMTGSVPAVISVASGVVLGNEIRIGGGQP